MSFVFHNEFLPHALLCVKAVQTLDMKALPLPGVGQRLQDHFALGLGGVQIVPSPSVVRLDFQYLLKMRNRFIDLSAAGQSNSQVVVGIGVAGLDFQCLPIARLSKVLTEMVRLLRGWKIEINRILAALHLGHQRGGIRAGVLLGHKPLHAQITALAHLLGGLFRRRRAGADP